MKLKQLKITTLALLSSLSFLLSCNKNNSENQLTNPEASNNSTISNNKSSDNSANQNNGNSIDSTIYEEKEIEKDFSITSETGHFSNNGTTYTITSSGTYTLKGSLNGQIIVEAGESDVVELDLEGVSITNSTNSPIFIKSADKVEISAKSDSYNVLTDNRSNKTTDSDEMGEGAIYAKADLKLKGSGTLIIKGNYNNGVHTSKDLKIQKLNLKVSSYNNAIKGKHSVDIISGNLLLHSSNGDGIKTDDTDLSNSGKQRGNIDISGGKIEIYSFGDGLDAAYDVNIYNGVDSSTSETTKPELTIYTNTYMSYGTNYMNVRNNIANNLNLYRNRPGGGGFPGEGGNTGPGSQSSNSQKATDSAKGIKGHNSVYISGGSNYILAYDDTIHASSGTAFLSGSNGLGNVYIEGGNTTLYASDDGIHADNALYLKGGETTVGCAYEGIEGNYVTISGGTHFVYAKDDAINASASNGGIEVTGGYMFASVPTSGDTDTIDSNGYYKQTGGVVIAIGVSSNGAMASCFDVDSTRTVSGGTLLCFGNMEVSPTSSLTKSNLTGTYSFTSSQTQKITFSNNESIDGLYLTISSYSTSNLTTPGTLTSSKVYSFSDKGSIKSISTIN